MSFVTVNSPKAPEPLACTTRSGMRSRLKWASFSKRWKSSKTMGPRSPAVSEFWLSGTGTPFAVVRIFFAMSVLPGSQKFDQFAAAEAHREAQRVEPHRVGPRPVGAGGEKPLHHRQVTFEDRA